MIEADRVIEGEGNESVSDMFASGEHAEKLLPVTLRATMRALSLRLISIEGEGGWFLIQRSAFDMTVGNEPHHALQVLYQASSLRYLGRGFNLFSSQTNAESVFHVFSWEECKSKGRTDDIYVL